MAAQAILERSTRSPRRPQTRRPERRRQPPAPRTRTLTDPRGREVRARQSLSLAIRQADQTYTLAARMLAEFDLYLEGVHRRLCAEGYLSVTTERAGGLRFPRTPARHAP